MWLAFLIGQIYLVARLWVKLVFWASETALFQGRLAHAGYVDRRRAELAGVARGGGDLRTTSR